MAAFVEQERAMQNSFDTFSEFADFNSDPFPRVKANLDMWRWSFASLPDRRMKAVAAGWMVRVLLGGDPAEMNQEEIEVLSTVTLLSIGQGNPEFGRSWCDA
ncbi:MAG TPA: hypothetical protein VHX60_03365 [Acidobacteriaceae bacterium]|jgi:hypothetical protein|nr:hypothetical protein [Acidobacteriaceae bacterium]